MTTTGPSYDRPGPDDEPVLRVRSYVLTGGRTRSAAELPLESLVRVTEQGKMLVSELTLERKEIVSRCHEPLSLAEISALLQIPLGVARVLVGDMAADGLLTATVPQHTGAGDRPELSILERVLDGLQAL